MEGTIYTESSGKAFLSRLHFKRDLEKVNEQDLQISGVFQKMGGRSEKTLLGSKNSKSCVSEAGSEEHSGERWKGNPAHGRTQTFDFILSEMEKGADFG